MRTKFHPQQAHIRWKNNVVKKILLISI
uniref:Uncharacterized protein n=1 Tax=Arundo donax TaxID=35708 RepID=A0A0A9AUF0_ARUDO